jgi:DNA-directed RNA polymerase subunit RPC12/RpoP
MVVESAMSRRLPKLRERLHQPFNYGSPYYSLLASEAIRAHADYPVTMAKESTVGPRIERHSIPESSDFDEVCSVCGQMVSGPHSWQQCAEQLAATRNAPCQECGSLTEMMKQAEVERDAAIADADDSVALLREEVDRTDALTAERDRLLACLKTISAIRDSIIGAQTVNWSEHVYPLVAALDAAWFAGAPFSVARENVGTLVEQRNAAIARAETAERVCLEMADQAYGRLPEAWTVALAGMRAKFERDRRTTAQRMRAERAEAALAEAFFRVDNVEAELSIVRDHERACGDSESHWCKAQEERDAAIARAEASERLALKLHNACRYCSGACKGGGLDGVEERWLEAMREGTRS